MNEPLELRIAGTIIALDVRSEKEAVVLTVRLDTGDKLSIPIKPEAWTKHREHIKIGASMSLVAHGEPEWVEW